MKILNDYDFSKYTSLKISVKAKYFAIVTTEEELISIINQYHDVNTIIIGDAPMDYMMGVQSGINSILISTGQIEKRDLLNITPFVCNNVSELRLQF